jgi:hypothetical protein
MTDVRVWQGQFEAAAYLAVARLAIRTIPFRWLVRFFERPVRTPELDGTARAAAREEVRAAIRGAGKRLPGGAVCFPRAFAAQAMLRRRGVSTTLYCGARRFPRRGLRAHVWLADGEHPVTGVHASAGHVPLAQYENRNPRRITV